MSDASNALLALQNACNGARSASEALIARLVDVDRAEGEAGLDGLDLEGLRHAAAAHALAAQALRGLIEELLRKREAAA
jgi:hypothetical protein